jgi:predicted dehydrogenase
MNLAILGTDSTVLVFIEAAISLGHQVVWVGDVQSENAVALQQLFPTLTPEPDWEIVLDHALADAVIVGQGTQHENERFERVKRLVADGIATVVTFPFSTSVLPYYELDMVRREVGGILLTLGSWTQAPPLRQLAKLITDGRGDIGQIRGISWVRQLATFGRVVVLESLAVDAEAILGLVGDITKVSAFGPAHDSEDFSGLSVQLQGAAKIPVHWSAARADGEITALLTLVGDKGQLEVAIPHPANAGIEANGDPWVLRNVADPEVPINHLASHNGPLQTCTRLDQAVHEQSPTRGEAEWDQAVKAVEIVDAVQFSLQRGRTVDVHHQQLTEQLAFRGMMSIFGCGLLLLGFLILLAAGVLGDTFYPPLFAWWPVGLALLLVLFLLLQLVPHTRGGSTSQRMKNDGQEDGGDGD